MHKRETQIGADGMNKPTSHGVAKRGLSGWWSKFILAGIVCWLCSCTGPQNAQPPAPSPQVGIASATSHSDQRPNWQRVRETPQYVLSQMTPETAAHNTQVVSNNQNPLYTWTKSGSPQASETEPIATAPAISILAYEKILLDRVSPTALRYQALAALLSTPNLQVGRLSDAALIAIVLDTLHHSERVRNASRSLILKFAGAKVARAYEAVLADVQAHRGSAQAPSHHQDWLAHIGLDMYCQYGERQLRQITVPTAASRSQLTQAIAAFQKAWALRTLVPAEKQHLFPKALYGWAQALEDQAWIEPDARGLPNMQYAQAAQAKYREFLAEAHNDQDPAEGPTYRHRAHLYHAESQQEQPVQRGSLKALAWRALSLTGSFETGTDEPNNFAGLAGNFDGQGISFGALQWNIGQQTLPKLLIEINRQQAPLIRRTFGASYSTLNQVLDQNKKQQMAWAKSIQNSKFVLHDPWRRAFKKLGTRYAFQKVQVEHADHLFQSALTLCKQYRVRSERAVALMFDILVQNGGIKKKTEAKIVSDFQALPHTGDAAEVARLRIIANRVAESAKAQWVADVRNRKLTIANGTGTVHGKHYNLAERGISLVDYMTRKPLGANPDATPPAHQAGLQSRL